ncbi:LysR family transcriptional regulator [Bradyrhizobium diazoefficiens]|uniref:LysR family transcriptional regulator n=1 Tax=Bradyrhizobium TaxID=374 RepID=UPI001E5BC55B|nr:MULTISPECIES: LysR family transcriptional regulator [Bradyrhizobium]MCD9297012.1 LysR family transcriptional regulator [Bradyrhizobium diazoefficiens]MCD9810030.1 LysR family transcriptional regulator [Bradyrhizobium diazoefficiens]MCD9827025.1 LysR family transcriptional regulator [Bradyrhizobium diazoefficiens]MCD9845016.1 LysR family transcriptional regulator [Bradyrhizobium diazoefficiens]MCD9881393.1 LysR family transcriptional regulator [Bradyrhizobium diazoefficiens]
MTLRLGTRRIGHQRRLIKGDRGTIERRQGREGDVCHAGIRLRHGKLQVIGSPFPTHDTCDDNSRRCGHIISLFGRIALASLADYATFLAVIDEGSLTFAATRLGRSLQSVSRSLARLEDDLGVELVSRTTRRLHPTPAGLEFAGRIRLALTTIDAAREDLLASDRRLAGTIRIGTSSLFGPEFVTPVLSQFLARNPEIDLELVLSDERVDLVAEKLDFAVRIGNLPDSNLRTRRIGGLSWAVFASPAYLAAHGRPEHPQELSRHECVLRASDDDRWAFGGNKKRIEVHGRFRSESAAARNAAVASGFGIGLAPLWQVRRLIDQGIVEQILVGHEPPPIPLQIVWPTRGAGAMPRRVRAAIDFLVARLSALRI